MFYMVSGIVDRGFLWVCHSYWRFLLVLSTSFRKFLWFNGNLTVRATCQFLSVFFPFTLFISFEAMFVKNVLFMTDKYHNLIILLCFEHFFPSANRFGNVLVWVVYLLVFILFICSLIKVLVADYANVRTGLHIFYWHWMQLLF